MDRDFGNWLAGFIAGEGCFTIACRGNGSYGPAFTLALREDDREILEEIQGRLGFGSIYRVGSRKQTGRNHGGRADFKIYRKEHLVALVAVLDQFPLRARKARDYVIWREAVLLWANRDGHRARGCGPRRAHPVQERLAELKARMERRRTYSYFEQVNH